MSLFEKIECEPIESESIDDTPQSSRKWTDETFTVAYQPGKKLLCLLYPLMLLPFFQIFQENDFFVLEVIVVAVAIAGAWYLGDCLLTCDFTFSPEKIVKRRFFGQTVLTTDAMVMTASEQNIRLFHGSEKNIREAVNIRRFLISGEESADIRKYAEDVYHVKSNSRALGSSAVHKEHASTFAVMAFDKSVSSYRMMAAFFIIFALIAIFTDGLSNKFIGLTPMLPAYAARLICICLATGGFFLLRWLALVSSNSDNTNIVPVTSRLEKIDTNAFISAAVSMLVACLGLVLYLLFGNMLDFYLFELVGILYFIDCYPRLSTWENTVGTTSTTLPAGEERVNLPRRSFHVSLVLMGTLAAASYGESLNYLYTSRKDCTDDGDGKDCQEATSGSTHFRTGRYYGPRYGSSGGRATHSVGVGTVSRGGFGSLGSFHASFGG